MCPMFNAASFPRQKTIWTATAIAALLFLTQTSQLLYSVAMTADSQAIIKAIDIDAANAIDVAQHSRWYNSNSFFAYGNLYFRIAATFGRSMTPFVEPGALSSLDAQTRMMHFSLLLTSLLALEGLAVLLASIVMRDWWSRLLLATGFVGVLVQSEAWQKLLFQAHPDHLLTLSTAVAVYFTAQWWRQPNDRRILRFAALGWGLALAVKSSALLFLPFVGCSILWIAPISRWRTALRFVSHLGLAYLIIGFPQNFLIHQTIKFLRYQSQYSQWPTRDSVLEWLSIYASQALRPLLLCLAILTVIGILGRTARRRPDIRAIVCGAGLAIGPFLLLLPQNILAPHQHYVMPIIACQLVLVLDLTANKKVHWNSWTCMLAIAGEFIVVAKFGLVPPTIDRTVARELKCRPEARATIAEMSMYRKNNVDIYIDPYIPAIASTPHVYSSWKTNKLSITERHYAALVLSHRYYARYFDDSLTDYVQIYNPALNASREFYNLFRDGKSFADPTIGSWSRKYSDDCGNEIWEPTSAVNE